MSNEEQHAKLEVKAELYKLFPKHIADVYLKMAELRIEGVLDE